MSMRDGFREIVEGCPLRGRDEDEMGMCERCAKE